MTNYPYHLSITSNVSPDYEIMHKGFTDPVCVLGFADVIDNEYLSSAYRVFDINEALQIFSGTTSQDSTLVRGMLELYHAGCRDIWLYPIATMDKYISPLERDSTFWLDLYTHYEDALFLLSEVDDIDILVPYDVDIEQGEFVNLFAEHCQSASRGNLRMTYFPYNGDPTNTFLGEDYHIVFINGTGIFHFPDHFTTDFPASMATTFAGMVSKLETNVPPDNRIIRTANLFFSDYTDQEELLEDNSVVGFRRTIGYKRVSDGTVLTTLSYTRSDKYSDFHTLYAMHTLQRFLRGISKLDIIGGVMHLGEESIKEYFKYFIRAGYCRAIESKFAYNQYTLLVDVLMYLPYPVGSVDVNLTIGPFL